MADAYSDIPLDQAGALGATAPAAVPSLSFFDKIRLGYKRGENAPDWGFNEQDKGLHAYQEIYDGLKKRGYRLDEMADMHQLYGIGKREADGERLDPRKEPFPWTFDQYGAMWKAFAAERAKDPKFLSQYGDVSDHATLIAHLRTGMNEALSDVDAKAPDGLGVPGFLGEIGHGFRDPLNYVGDGAGTSVKATTILGKALSAGSRAAAVNVGITAATEPFVRESYDQRGMERANSDFFLDLGVAAGVGFVAGGAAEAVPATIEHVRGKPAPVEPPAPADAPGTAAAAPEAVPEVAPEPALSDKAVAEAFAAAVPPEQRTPGQQAALNAIERDGEVKAVSPFVDGPVGDDEHAAWLDVGLRALNGDNPLPTGNVKAIPREQLAAGTVDASTTRNPPRATLKAKIHSAEAPNGGYNLLGSGALGPYQFMPQTWVSLFKKRYPNDTRSFDQIAALRTDPALNELLIDDLVNENSTALRHAGLPETTSNLYLAHVLGYDRAITVLRAAPDTPIGELLPHSYFAKNPFKADWSAAKLAAWSDRRMGGKGEAGAFQVAETGEKIDTAELDMPDVPHPETGRNDVEAMLGIAGDDRPILKPEMFDTPEEHAAAQMRFEASRDATEGYATVRSADDLFTPGEHFAGIRQYQGTVTEEAMAEALGIRPDQLRRAVQTMQASDPNSPFIYSQGGKPKKRVVDGKTETYFTEPRLIRRPPRPGQRNTGPESLLEFLAAHGGMKDRQLGPDGKVIAAGGDLRAMGAGEWHKGKRFRGRLIRDDGMTMDDAFMAAREAGFFPELGEAGANRTYGELPDIQRFRDAIDHELRGNKRYRPEDFGNVESTDKEFRWGSEEQPEGRESAESEAQAFWDRVEDPGVIEQLADAAQQRGIRLDDDMMIEAHDRVLDGEDPQEALDNTMLAAASRDLEDYAATSGEIGYGFDDEGRRFNDDTGLPEQREGQPDDLPPPDSDGRPAPVTEAAREGAPAFAKPADDPAEGRFSDPVGEAATLQADSLEHDLRMEAGLNDLTDGVKSDLLDADLSDITADDVPALFDALPADREAWHDLRAKIVEERPDLAVAALDQMDRAPAEAVDAEQQARFAAIDAVRAAEAKEIVAAVEKGRQLVLTNPLKTSYIKHSWQVRATSKGFQFRMNGNKNEWFSIGADDHTHLMAQIGKQSRQFEPLEADLPTYRLDEEGDESDLASILDEIEQAQKAAAEMRGCMAPPTPKGEA